MKFKTCFQIQDNDNYTFTASCVKNYIFIINNLSEQVSSLTGSKAKIYSKILLFYILTYSFFSRENGFMIFRIKTYIHTIKSQKVVIKTRTLITKL